MSTNLYEELGIAKDATDEQIRKAYKKRALQTHPDRLPQNATAEDKANSEENFRKVNNAYEVLIDAEKRREYDIHGVWPPPETPSIPDTPNFDNNPFAQEFFNMAHGRGHFGRQPFGGSAFGRQHHHHHHHHPRHYEFTDPFTLFDQIFARVNVTPMDPPRHRHRAFVEPWDMDDDMGAFGRPAVDPFGFGFGMGLPVGGGLSRQRSMFGNRMDPHFHSSGPSSGIRYTAESTMTSTVNGVTQTIHKRVDADGNEIVTVTYPDGREVQTVNGVEQHAGYIADGPSNNNPRITEGVYSDNQHYGHRSQSSSRRRQSRHHHHHCNHHHHHEGEPAPATPAVDYDANGTPLPPPPYPGPTGYPDNRHRHHATQNPIPNVRVNDRQSTYPPATTDPNMGFVDPNANIPHGAAHARDSRQQPQPQSQRGWWSGFRGRQQ